MPDNVTHRRVGPAAASVVLWGFAVPWFVWPLVLWLAEVASPWPDHMEGPPRRMRRRLIAAAALHWRAKPLLVFEPLLRYLQRHRWWTHGLLSEAIVAALIGGVLIGAQFGLVALVVEVASANSSARVVVPAAVQDVAAWLGIFVALGLWTGMAAHSLLDTGTEWGSPIGWPLFGKRVRLLPKALWIGERGEAWLCRLARPFVCAMAFLAFAPSWWLPYAWGYVAALLW